MVTDLHAIRARLLRLELSERRFAKLLGISQPTLNARLNGDRRVPAGFEAQCVEALDRWEEAECAAAEARARVLERRPVRRVSDWPASRQRGRATDAAASARR